MARIRTIKPEFWSDETVGECSPTSRLLFLGIWNYADDHGGIDRSAKQLRAQIFPYDNFDCEPLVQELLGHDLLIEYQVDGKKFLYVPGFAEHQKIEKKSKPRVPLYEESLRTRGVVGESSPTSSGSSLGREGKGKGKGSDPTAAARPTNGQSTTDFEQLKTVYPKRAGGNPWPRAERALRARVREGHTLTEILDGARRYAAFVRAVGKEGTEYVMQAATFCGPDKRFLEAWEPPPSKAQVRQDENVQAGLDWLRSKEAADAAA